MISIIGYLFEGKIMDTLNKAVNTKVGGAIAAGAIGVPMVAGRAALYGTSKGMMGAGRGIMKAADKVPGGKDSWLGRKVESTGAAILRPGFKLHKKVSPGW